MRGARDEFLRASDYRRHVGLFASSAMEASRGAHVTSLPSPVHKCLRSEDEKPGGLNIRPGP